MICMEADDLYAYSTLVHKEKVTGHHHPYASKPTPGHSSSSRENIVDDEDNDMPPNNSETNDEPRRHDFKVHEKGPQSNSEFPTRKCPSHRVCLSNTRSERK
ncbi:hypothetical protein O181_084058 [Austropuccinia psidii MF-1]|uniref:Uncharacterized protein n=1 Tax=Austropuccinia psidii MF-1 TaxID=1389203 RepID=A0A9Q3IK81_9BASI|nr:hypothetical protein [Austropuccinia psidii MF-1]